MNRRLSKRINKKALDISIEWLKTVLPDSEVEKIAKKVITTNNPLSAKNGTAWSTPYSYRGSKAYIKLILKRKLKALDDITIRDIEDRVRTTRSS